MSRLAFAVKTLLSPTSWMEEAPFVHQLRGSKGKAKIVILTITDQEFPIVQGHFGLHQNILGSPYFVADSSLTSHDIALFRAPNQTTIPATQVTGDAIEELRPDLIVLIGTAGGHSKRDNVCLGDVIIADYVDFSNYVKYSDGYVWGRKLPHDHPSAFMLENFVAGVVGSEPTWVQDIDIDRPVAGAPKIVRGEIVSGDRLWGDPAREEQQDVLKRFDKGLGFEMEAMGVARAVYRARRMVSYNPQYLVVRGVSDYVDKLAHNNQEDRERWTPYAVKSATVVAAKILDRLIEFEQRR